MNAERIQNAEKLVAEGKKHLSTGLFKWKPDVDSAIECFDKGKITKNTTCLLLISTMKL